MNFSPLSRKRPRQEIREEISNSLLDIPRMVLLVNTVGDDRSHGNKG